MTAFKELMPREINRLIHLTENFLGLAKPSTAAHPVVDLSQVIHRVARLLRPLFEGKKATLTVTAPADLGLKASESQMESLILNLLQNAFQSIQAGGTVSLLARSLKRSSQGPGPWVELQVKDNGEGVFHGDLSLIFDPFFSTKEGGTGLGLAICQKIVQNHQGFLTVKNSPRKGVIFSAVLPLR